VVRYQSNIPGAKSRGRKRKKKEREKNKEKARVVNHIWIKHQLNQKRLEDNIEGLHGQKLRSAPEFQKKRLSLPQYRQTLPTNFLQASRLSPSFFLTFRAIRDRGVLPHVDTGSRRTLS
jgi:hypothetical protein